MCCTMIIIDSKEKVANIENTSGCPNGSVLLKLSIKFLSYIHSDFYDLHFVTLQ